MLSCKNFYTKANLLAYLLDNRNVFTKVLVFVSTKVAADRLFKELEEEFMDEIGVIHANKAKTTVYVH